MKPMVNIIKTASGTKGKITGELTLKHADALLALFHKLRAKQAITALTIDQPASVDLCFLQLLWAYVQACRTEGKDIAITSTLQSDALKLIKLTGFETLLHPLASTQPNVIL